MPLTEGPGIAVCVVGPLPVAPCCSTYILIFAGRFSRRAEVFAVTAAEFTVEGMANVLINRYILSWGCPRSTVSDTSLHRRSKFAHAVSKLLGFRKITTSYYHPNSNGGVECLNHTMDQMLAMIVNELQFFLDEQHPYVEHT